MYFHICFRLNIAKLRNQPGRLLNPGMIYETECTKIVLIMKKFLYICSFFILLCPALSQAQTDKLPADIVLSFKAGNATELAKHFHSNVELIILEEEDVYSRSQAEQIIRKFFSDHKPSSFRVIFEGGKENSRYAIGSLETSNARYRVYVLMKKQDNTPLIHQLRIETEKE
jgi:hypothetical protein